MLRPRRHDFLLRHARLSAYAATPIFAELFAEAASSPVRDDDRPRFFAARH